MIKLNKTEQELLKLHIKITHELSSSVAFALNNYADWVQKEMILDLRQVLRILKREEDE